MEAFRRDGGNESRAGFELQALGAIGLKTGDAGVLICDLSFHRHGSPVGNADCGSDKEEHDYHFDWYSFHVCVCRGLR
jgi:hypothetical protein